jgi:hypothetical protein
LRSFRFQNEQPWNWEEEINPRLPSHFFRRWEIVRIRWTFQKEVKTRKVIEHIYKEKQFYHLYSAKEIFDEGSKTIFWDTRSNWSVTHPLNSILNEPII